jgi:hypothetical protein
VASKRRRSVRRMRCYCHAEAVANGKGRALTWTRLLLTVLQGVLVLMQVWDVVSW